MALRNLVIVMLVIISALGFIIWQSQQSVSSPKTDNQTVTTAPSTQEKIISITSAGFEPSQITIKVGESVTWINNDSSEHQVNSSPHPAHTDYPPLNTVDLLQAGEKKSLTFPEKGTYKFHDHLNPQMFGSVIVD